MIKKLTTLAVIASLSSGFAASAVADSATDKLKGALASEHRTDKEKARDRNRMPIQTLNFLGIKEDMRVIELVPGYGWYTKLLGPLLKGKGQLYVGVGTGRLGNQINENPLMKGVKKVAEEAKLQYNREEGLYDLVNPDLEVRDLDAVLTFRNYHNFTYEGRMAMNKAAFDALKPGGIYGVVDHTRRHMEEENTENRRRIDPVLAIKEIQAAGFEFVDYSALHYRPDDELRYEVGRKSVTGNTDRFTFLFKKPKQ